MPAVAIWLAVRGFAVSAVQYLVDHPRVALAVAVLAAGLIWGDVRFHQGEAAASARYERQIAAQQAANDQAARRAGEALMKSADRLSLKSIELEKALSDVSTATDQSGTGDSIALPRSVVRQLDRIR